MHKILSNPNWQRYILGKVCNIQIGGTPARNEQRFWSSNDNGHLWVAISDLGPKWITTTAEHITDDGVKHSNVKPVPKGTLLMSFKLTIGRVGFAGSDLYTNEAIAAFSPKGKHVWLPWLYYALPSIIEDNIAAEQAIKGQTLNKRKLQNFVFHCPKCDEQRLVANILDSLDTQIQQTEQLIAKLKQIKIGLLHDLLTRGIDENGDVRDPMAHPEGFKNILYGNLKIPVQWNIYPLKKVAKISSGVTLGRKLTGVDTIELPYLRVANVQDGYLNLTEMKHIRVPKHEVDRFLLQPGDVLMTEGGDFDKLGRGTLWTGEIPNCLHQNHIFKVRTDRSYLHPEFLALISRSSYGKHFFLLSSKQSTNLASINSTQLKAFPIPCPTKEEQERIVNILNVHDAHITAEEFYLAKLKRLKKGLMHDLLTGRVRVTQLIAESKQLDVRSKSVFGFEG
jgi:type I restriction enzyme, S subunit